MTPVSRSPLASLADALEARLGHGIELQAPIAQFTTYRLGGPAALLVRVDSISAVAALAEVVAEYRPPVLVVGKGSNLLVADRGFGGVAVVLEGDFAGLTIDAGHIDSGSIASGRARVHAGGGVGLQALARATAAEGWSGLEFYVGIPGSVGGAVCMNAGGHGRETAEVLGGVDIFRLGGGVPGVHLRRVEVEHRSVSDLDLGYRHSNVGPTDLVLSADFEVTAAPVAQCQETIADIVRWRRENQPGGSNGGSVFRNPPGDSAGRLIDALGLKELRVGGAMVSPKHANFFQAEAGATADDVYALIGEVQRRVLDATGIALVPELRMVGFDADADADAGAGADADRETGGST